MDKRLVSLRTPLVKAGQRDKTILMIFQIFVVIFVHLPTILHLHWQLYTC